MLENVTTVQQLKTNIGKTKGLDSEKLLLKYRNKTLKNEQTLTSFYQYWEADSIEYKMKQK